MRCSYSYWRIIGSQCGAMYICLQVFLYMKDFAINYEINIFCEIKYMYLYCIMHHETI